MSFESYRSRINYLYPSLFKAVGQALGLPLFRKEITRRPISLGNSYVLDNDDEVEDLYDLLKTAKHQYPELKGFFYK